MADVLEVSSRDGTGKGAARSARREGMVPGVVYGGGKDPRPVNIKFNELIKRLKAGRFTASLLTLSVDGEEERVICRAVQRDVVKDLPIHCDFLRLSERSRISLYIPVEFINHEECPGLKRGGTLQVVRPEVELRVTAGAIPEKLVCDLAGHELGDTIHVSEIELPKGTRTTIDRDFVIANIATPSGLAAADDEDEADETEVEAEADAEETAEE